MTVRRAVPFVKMEGCGNDYVFVDVGLTADGVDPAALEPVDALARDMADRHFGIGSDGLITVGRGDAAPVRMRMWNLDGSEGKLCLNGLRCVAKYAAERVADLGGAFVVETAAGPRRVAVARDDRHRVVEVEIRLAPPDFRRSAIPAAGDGAELWGEAFHLDGRDFEGFAVSMGNPHLVFFMADADDLHKAHLGSIGVPLEHDRRFPEGVNVHLVAVLPDGDLEMRSWERGSGATLACGSGAAAVYAIARRLGRAGALVDVRMPGGSVELREDGGELLLRGPAREVFRGVWDPSP